MILFVIYGCVRICITIHVLLDTARNVQVIENEIIHYDGLNFPNQGILVEDVDGVELLESLQFFLTNVVE